MSLYKIKVYPRDPEKATDLCKELQVQKHFIDHVGALHCVLLKDAKGVVSNAPMKGDHIFAPGTWAYLEVL